MIVAEAQSGDLPAIEGLRRETFSHFAPHHYSSVEVENLLADFNADEAAKMIEEQAFFVVRDADRIIACAAWHGSEVRHVYVAPLLAGQGLGRRVLLHAERDFHRRTGLGQMRASVIVYARGFYEKNGYLVLSQEKDWDGSAYYKMMKAFVTTGR